MSRSKVLLVLATCVVVSSTNFAIAQTAPQAPPASKSGAAPEAGANSFTEAQAKDRMEQAGFKDVTGLRKDEQGIWRASAKQGDKQVNVSLDFRGNVIAQ